MTAEEFKNGLVDVVFRALDRFGVPVVMLAALLYFGREAATAMHESFVKPIVKAHIEFLDATRETLGEIGDVQKKQADALEDLSVGQREILGVVRQVASGSENNGGSR